MSERKYPYIDRGKLTISELAKRTGRSPATVARYTSRPREEYLAQAQQRATQAQQLRAEGKTMREIAAELKMSVGGVYAALNR